MVSANRPWPKLPLGYLSDERDDSLLLCPQAHSIASHYIRPTTEAFENIYETQAAILRGNDTDTPPPNPNSELECSHGMSGFVIGGRFEVGHLFEISLSIGHHVRVLDEVERGLRELPC